jgi:tRNA threonylcarbamoyladenosine biosynthesis protein TsaB
MKILAIESATDLCGVALTENQKLVAEYKIQQRNVHNEKLVTAVEFLLADAGWQIENLDGLAVSIGPGSFTGLRIGISVCKGLAFTADLPLVAVNTLDAMARETHCWRGKMCTAIKARAEEVYFAIYEKDVNSMTRVSDYQIAGIETLDRSIKGGTLVVISPAELRSQFSNKDLVFCDNAPLLSAHTIAQLGYQKLLGNETADLETIEPFYLKDFQPKRKVYSYDSALAN